MIKENIRAISLLLLGVFCTLFIQFFVSPANRYYKQQTTRLESAYHESKNISGAIAKYIKLQQKVQQQAEGAQNTKGTLYASFDNAIRKLGLQDKVTSITPSSKTREDGYIEQVIKIKCENFYQNEVLNLLFMLEYSLTGIRVSKIHIQKDKNKLINFTMELVMTVMDKL